MHLSACVIQRRNAKKYVIPGLSVMLLFHYAGVHQCLVIVKDGLGEAGGTG